MRTDMLWDKFSTRKKGWIDTIAYIVFFLPTMAILFFMSVDDFLYSMSINEKSNSGAWQPIIWPLRAAIPITGPFVHTGHFRAHEEPLGRAHGRRARASRKDRDLRRS